jgi:hypothetical protein
MENACMGKKAPPVRHDDPTMRGPRSRNEDGQLRQKRSDTQIGTIENEYGIDLGVRSDMELGTYLEQHGLRSLSELLDKEGK